MSGNVAIVEYGMGNLYSVARAFEECGARPFITSDPRDLEKAPTIVLPGVGSFARGMQNLRESGLVDVLTEQVLGRGVPFLGICLGMQLMAKVGYEHGETPGLGWVDGSVERLVSDSSERIPHVGWNGVSIHGEQPIFDATIIERDFYFVHSFAMRCKDESAVIARTPYCGGFVSAVKSKSAFGVQFHPEKSQRAGFRLIKNFLAVR